MTHIHSSSVHSKGSNYNNKNICRESFQQQKIHPSLFENTLTDLSWKAPRFVYLPATASHCGFPQLLCLIWMWRRRTILVVIGACPRSRRPTGSLTKRGWATSLHKTSGCPQSDWNQCTLHSIHRTLRNAHCKLNTCTEHWPLHIAHFFAHCTRHTAHCTLFLHYVLNVSWVSLRSFYWRHAEDMYL